VSLQSIAIKGKFKSQERSLTFHQKSLDILIKNNEVNKMKMNCSQ